MFGMPEEKNFKVFKCGKRKNTYIVLMGIKMPRLNGSDVAGARTGNVAGCIPIVAM